jgi:hypothetical protein
MAEGTFSPTGIVALCKLDGKTLLVNGQHTMHAVVKSGRGFMFTVQEYTCKDKEDVSSVYSRFDVHKRRTENEILNSMDVCEKYGLSKTERTFLAGAVKAISRGFRLSSGKNDYRFNDKYFVVSVMEEWIPHLKHVLGLMDGGERISREILRRRHIMAACLWISRHVREKDRKKADEFIRGIAMNDGMRRGDPRKIFIDEVHGMRSDTDSLCIFCGAWNTFVKGEWNGAQEKSTRQSISKYANHMKHIKRVNMSGTKPVFELRPMEFDFSASKPPVREIVRMRVGRRRMVAKG